MFQKIIAFCSA